MDANEKSERLIEVACAALDCAPHRQLNTVVLNKTLFYVDLASLRDHGKTLTGNSYVALQQGPVVAKYQTRLIGNLQDRGLAKQLSEWDGSKPMLLETDLEHFSHLGSDDFALIAKVTSFFANLSSREASDYSHRNPGWKIAWRSFETSQRPAAINMLVAMQQIIEEDPWMDTPLLDGDDALSAADVADGVEW